MGAIDRFTTFEEIYENRSELGWWARYIIGRELEAAKEHEPYKDISDFDWGLEYLGLEDRAGDPFEAICEYNEEKLADSREYFSAPRLSDDAYTLRDGVLRFPSNIRTEFQKNNTVHCRYFPSRSKKAVVVVPHWCATYDRVVPLCKLVNFLGYSSLLMSLPFHDERMTDGRNIPYEMVSPNIGLTILSMQQAVQDISRCIDWLQARCHERIGIVGSSIGSCAAFMSASHDPRVSVLINNLMSSYFGEVVWSGISTYHIRKSVEGAISREDLKNLWLLNSPACFVAQNVRYNTGLKNLVISGAYDTTFLPFLTKLFLDTYEKHREDFSARSLSCGHYTLAELFYKYLDGLHIALYLRRHL